MTDVNTDSYPKPGLPVSPLDMAQKLGGLQQQQQQIQSGGLTIDKQKLDLVTQHMAVANHELSILANDPNLDQQKVTDTLNRIAKATNMPSQVYQKMHEEYAAAGNDPAKLKETVDLNLKRGMSVAEQLANQYGTPGSTQDNANVYSGVQKGPMQGGGFVPATTMPIQPPPTQPNVNNQRLLPNGQPNPNYLQPGIVGASGPPGVVPVRPSLPVAGQAGGTPIPQARPNGLPVERPSGPSVSGPTGPTSQTGFDFKQRFAGEPIATGAAPGVASAIETIGKKSGEDYATDLTRSKSLQTDLYPMNRVLDIVKEEGPKAFGPGTEGLNTLKSALVTWLPNVDQKTIDSVSNYEQAKKYLVQAARTAGNTGTNDQLAAAFEANPNVKMSGATIENIVKSNIALRKMQHAQTILFGQQNLPPSEYSQWVSKNQNSLDPRAFGFDMMSGEAKKKLVDTLKKDPKAYQKFETSLQFAHDADLIEKPARN